jgi:hypothetical protein
VVVTPAGSDAPVVLERGRAAFVPASTERYALAAENTAGERASLYRATVNLT